MLIGEVLANTFFFFKKKKKRKIFFVFFALIVAIVGFAALDLVDTTKYNLEDQREDFNSTCTYGLYL